METGIEIKGLNELIKQTDDAQLIGAPLGAFFVRSAVAVQARAKAKTPVDRGQLRQAIDYKVDNAPIPSWAKIGIIRADYSTPLGKKAHAMEYGTGLFAEGPNAKKQRYFPPPRALDLWAKRHGFPSGFVVAMIIFKKGGLEPRRFLRDGFKESLRDIDNFLRLLEQDIEREWRRL